MASTSPDTARLVTDDLPRFWQALEQAGPDVAVAPFARLYLEAGTPGLREFARLRVGEAWQLAEAVRQRPRYYASLRHTLRALDALAPEIRRSFHALARLYPEARFPDVYFLVGRFQAAGTDTDDALLIGAEFYGLREGVPLDELTPWEREVLLPPEAIPAIVAHELIHFNQRHPEADRRTLLRAAIEEGAADFLGELISGRRCSPHVYAYGAPRERQLWAEFRRDMHGDDVYGWLYDAQRPREPGRPADLGYFIGYKIVEAYCRRTSDARRAVRDILHIEDFPRFLHASGYDP